MPELPDIEVFSASLQALLQGRTLRRVQVINGQKLKDSPETLSEALEGRKLLEVFRAGKEFRLRFSGDVVLGMHLVLSGDLFTFGKTNEQKFTIVELYFSGGVNLALTDRMRNAYVKLNPEEKGGIDALDKALSFEKLKALLQSKALVRNVLLNQDKIRGIGNGYADEILWEARISPFSVASAIPDDKVKDLLKAIRSVLQRATKSIAKKYPGRLQGEVRDFMRVHTSERTESPTGYPIKKISRGLTKVHYTDEQVLYT
ncbi:MAG: Fpg/Nei family DNA glycosylase [Sphingobacteriales bacterium]|nr:MAG: Fpg/Nei family DNA glycosylase [Sphingobacteriales bacterium]